MMDDSNSKVVTVDHLAGVISFLKPETRKTQKIRYQWVGEEEAVDLVPAMEQRLQAIEERIQRLEQG